MKHDPGRSAPAVSWTGVLTGALLAVAVALLANGLAITAVAVAAGGFLAGRISGAAGLFQGAIVAVLFIVIQGIAGSFGPAASADLVVDTAATLGRDALYLALGATGGWLATRS